METGNAIELKGVTKRFGDVIANDNVNLTVRKGEILSILGENGSGKTTLMNMLSGIYFPDEGEIYVDGKEVTIRSPKDSFALGIGMIHQHFKLINILTAAENIILGLPGKEKLNMKQVEKEIRELTEQYGFDLNPSQKIYDMSVSQKQTVEIVKVLYRGADILILDEPTAGLDPKERIRIRNLISDLSEDRIVLIATHVVSDIEFISKEILLMKNGRLVDQDSPENLQKRIYGHVYELCISQDELAEVKKEYEISNLFRRDGEIIVRVIADKCPVKYDAVKVSPTLEDVYLYEFEGVKRW